MTDARQEPTPEQRLALLVRGVQRMADALGGIDERLEAMAGRVEEDRVRSRAEVAQVGERVDRLQADVARSLDVVTAVGHAVDAVLRAPAAPAPAPTDDLAVEHLREAVRALRDDLATAWGQLREQTADAVDRVAGEQAERTLRLVESVAETRRELLDAVSAIAGSSEATSDLPQVIAQLRETLDGRHVVVTEALERVQRHHDDAVAALRAELAQRFDSIPDPPPVDDTALRHAIAEVSDEVRRLGGELEASAGQLRTDVGSRQAQLRDEVVAAVEERLAQLPQPAAAIEPVLERLDALEAKVGPTDLSPLLERLEGVEARLAALPEPTDVDLGPLAERLALIDARLHDQAQAQAPPVDMEPLRERLAAIEWRLGEVLDPLATRLGPLDALDGLETRFGEALAPLRERLDALDARLGDAFEPIRERLAADPDQADDLLGRLATIEGSLASLRRDLSVELESVAADNRRGVDRIVGEVRTVDERVGGMADDLRVVRQLRDGLQDLLDGVDATRQLAARAATSQQMAEVTRELGSVLAEIESARSHVVRVERGPQSAQQAQVVDVEVDRLGRRIEQLAEAIEDRMSAEPAPTSNDSEVAEQVISRLRNLGAGARQLGNGMLEDLRTRRRR